MFKDNWAYYSYNGEINSTKVTPKSKFDFVCSLEKEINKSHTAYLSDNSIEIYEKFGKLDLLFSGGSSSQIILKTYHDLKIPISVKICAYENNLNYKWDVAAALKFCEDNNIKYEIINFDLQKFFEKEALDYFYKSHCYDITKLPLMKMLEYCDNTPILGTGFPLIERSNYFYGSKAEWKFKIIESDINMLAYGKEIGRSLIANWFIYSLESLKSLTLLPELQMLVNDRFNNIFSSYEIRNKIYNLYISNRVSQKGFEHPETLLYPHYMIDFYNNNIKGKVNSDMKIIDQLI